MKKRFLTLLLATTMVCSLFTACGDSDNKGTTNNSQDISTENQVTEDNKLDKYSEIEKRYLEECQERYDRWKENGTADRFVIIEFEGQEIPFFCMHNPKSDKYMIMYSMAEDVAYNKSKFSKEGYLYDSMEVSRGILHEEYYIILSDEENIWLQSISYDKEIYFAGLNKNQYYKDGEEITEEEFNKEMERLKDCEWVEISSIDTWYTDIYEAYDNRLRNL